MTDGKKGFIWGVIVVLVLVFWVRACSDTPEAPVTPSSSAPVDNTGGGTGSGPNGIYQPPPDLTIPQIDIPSAAPTAPAIESPAQAAPAPAIPSPQ